MKIIFTTDLHGIQWKYLRVLELARKLNVDAVVNGGDLLPVEGDLALQDEFILDFLDDYFLQYESSSITHLSVMGNTDLKRFDPLFNEISSHYNCIQNLATNNFKINGYEFIGLDVMPDYPFRLKDRCRLDTPEDNIQEQFGKGFLSTANGWEDIEYWPGFVKTLPTIEEELEQLPTPEFMEKSIYVMHMPPAFLGLDVCQGNVKVGSRAIYNFFEKTSNLYFPSMDIYMNHPR